MPQNVPTVVIIGRINTGKSTLFNRLTETKKAITSPIAGTTRDRNYGQVLWRGKTFNLIDTGGINIETLKNSFQALLPTAKFKKIIKTPQINSIEAGIIKQTKKAVKTADLILMVVDGKEGLLPEDKELALILKKIDKSKILVCNKIDNPKLKSQAAEFYKLGLGKPIMVSAANGSGIGDLLEIILKELKSQKSKIPNFSSPLNQKLPIKVAIIGKPNVGKSSLVNQILGEERVIVSEIPQTTREPQDTLINFKDEILLLIDTAGLKKKAKIHPGIEKTIAKKTIEAIKKADIILFILNSHQTLSSQDSRLAKMIIEARAGTILVANKRDLLTGGERKIKELINYYQNYLPQLFWAPVIFVSAKTGWGVKKILDLILKIYQERKKEISQSNLNKFLKEILKKQKPAQAKGRQYPYLYSITQTAINPPEFTIILGQHQRLNFSYQRYLIKQIRKKFGFEGIPIKIKVSPLK